jgi:hypothetical protein
MLLLNTSSFSDLNFTLSVQSVLGCVQILVEVIVVFMLNEAACHEMFRVYFHWLFLCFNGSLDRIAYPIEHQQVREGDNDVDDVVDSIDHRLGLMRLSDWQLKCCVKHVSQHEWADVRKELENLAMRPWDLFEFVLTEKFIIIYNKPSVVTFKFKIDEDVSWN